MNENADERKSNDKWLDLRLIFEGVSKQINDIQPLDAAVSSQDIGPGYSGDEPSNDVINHWQKLTSSQINDDLASVFQDELELEDVSPGLNEWMIAPEEIEEGDKPDDEVRENRVNEEVFSRITFSLKPNSNDHFLHGRIRDDLQHWIPVICDQYCWQLDFLLIRPNQLTWKLRDFPESLIREMFQIVRERTSERLFQVFPGLRSGITSGDFWSPGYYVDAER